MELLITEFENRKNPVGKLRHYTWESFKSRLKNAFIAEEFRFEYESMTNEQRTEAKDIGGYVAGEFEGNKRSKALLKSRCVLTIDADDAKPDDVEAYLLEYDTVFFAHTTHSSTDESPRLRWLFPLSRPVTAEEYRRLAAVVCSWVGADTIDETTDQPERLMFWPSVPNDVSYHYWEGGSDVLDPDVYLPDAPIPEEPDDTEPVYERDDTPVLSGNLIGEGKRNRTVFKYAATLRQAGLDKDVIFESLKLFNDKYCDPPLPKSELRIIAGSVSKYKKGDKIPFGMRDISDDFGDIGELKEKKTGIQAVKASELEAEDIDPPVFLVPNLIPVGLTLIVAPPKFGKSWLCLDLALSISTGTEFLDMPTEQHGVLYLALEDNYWRLQNRMRRVIGMDQRISAPSNLFLTNEAPLLAEDFVKHLDKFLKDHDDIRLVIIDTLQKVRGLTTKRDNAYNIDYNDIGKLQKFAMDNGVGLLLVHHTKKGVDESDFVMNASGTNGITGSADSILTLSRRNRKDKRTVLDITGRDVVGRTYILQFNDATFRWENLGEEKDFQASEDETEYSSDPVVKTVRYYLDAAESLPADEDDDPEYVHYERSSKELYDDVQRMFGEDCIDSATSIGMRVKKYAPLFEKIDNILVEKKRTKRCTVNSFIRPREVF